jgi:hypothetical protein
MLHRIPNRHLPRIIAGLAVVAAIVVLAIPPEAKLGGAIRIVLLHGALARTGIVMLGIGAMAGAVMLIMRRDGLAALNRTLQTAALWTWIVYFVSSVIATWITWGVPVAWDEPRTQASLKILAMVIVFALVTRRVGQPMLTAFANLVAGLMAFFLVKSAGAVQHPLNAVMGANAAIFPALFLTLWAVLVAMALTAARWLHVRNASTGSD